MSTFKSFTELLGFTLFPNGAPPFLETKQLGVGETGIVIESTPSAFISYGFDAPDEFREVIVAKKYQGITPPLPVAPAGGSVTASELPGSPRDAESAAKSYLGISSNYQLDRWWMKSTDCDEVTQYSDPADGAFGFTFAMRAIAQNANDDVIALLDFYKKTISSVRTDYWLLTAHEGSDSGPDIDPDGTKFEKVENPNPATFTTEAAAAFPSGYSKWEIKETTTKLSPTQNYPLSWFTT